MATIGECADALAAQVGAATGLRAFGYVPEDLHPPALLVAFSRMDVVAMASATVELRFDLVVLTARISDRVGQSTLFDYLSIASPRSVIGAILADTTLGGLLAPGQCSPLSESVRALGVEEIASYGFYGAVVPVLIVTSGA